MSPILSFNFAFAQLAHTLLWSLSYHVACILGQSASLVFVHSLSFTVYRASFSTMVLFVMLFLQWMMPIAGTTLRW